MALSNAASSSKIIVVLVHPDRTG